MATLSGKIVMFGGAGGSTDPIGTYKDTWRSTERPGRRSRRNEGKVLVFGGWDGGTSLNPTQTFDGTTWTTLNVANPPSPRAMPRLAAVP